jgi:hypothetical protein
VTEKDPLVIIGYDAKSIELRVGTSITLPQTFSTRLVSPCTPPSLCIVDKAVPAGLSGGPVVDRYDNLVGVFKGGDDFTSRFQPLREVLSSFEDICHVFLTEDYKKYCETKNIKEREQEQSFSEARTIHCDRAGAPDDNKPLVYPAPDGFKISEFVTHDEDKTDNAGNGWVGHVEYMLSDDDQYVKAVKLQLGCSRTSDAAPEPGWAETRIKGNIKRILKDEDYSEIKALCSR